MVSKFLAISLFVVSALATAVVFVDGGPSEFGSGSTPEMQKLSTANARQSANLFPNATAARSFESPLARIDPKEFAVISEHTLFSSLRRPPPSVQPPIVPPPVAPAVIAPALPDPDEFTLLGVSTSSDERVALVRSNKTQEITRLRPGDDYTGWRITEVRDRSVLIEQRGSVFSLSLFNSEKSTAAQD